MRIGRFLGVLACIGGTVLAAGCGTEHASSVPSQTPDLAAAVSHTQGQTARIAATISTKTQGMTVSISETGLFDFARSRGTVTIQGPVGMTEIFLPPTMYIKVPDAAAGTGGLPQGKRWVALPDKAGSVPAFASEMLGPFGGGGDPADLLASLTAVSSSVTRLGASTVRGVPVTGFALTIDPAKAAAGIPAADRAAAEAFLKGFGAAEIPVDVWVDGQNLVRQERISLALPGGSGEPAGTRLTVTTDFYDFGVPVEVSAPPAAQVARQSQALSGMVAAGASNSASPPPDSGTLTRDQASSAEQAVTAFWAALGRGNTAATERVVLPGQRSCVQSFLGGGGPVITVSSLHITSAEPAGNSAATVRFTVKAQASLGGKDIPVFPQAPGGPQWLATTEVAGHWYVNLVDSTALIVGGACG